MTDTPLIETPGLRELLAEKPELFYASTDDGYSWPVAYRDDSGWIEDVDGDYDLLSEDHVSAIIEKRLREACQAVRPCAVCPGTDRETYTVIDTHANILTTDGQWRNNARPREIARFATPLAALIAAYRAKGE